MVQTRIELDPLLEAAAGGNQEALAELFDAHRERLLKMIRLRLDRRLQRRVDTADILQETFLTVQKKFPAYAAAPSMPFFLWLRLETGQKLADVHRFHLRVKMRDARQEVSLHRHIPSVDSMTLAERLLGRLTSASQAAMRAELKLQVQDVLNSMEPHDREILVLRHFEELNNGEAAQTLGISPTACCNRYVRAIKRLKSAFEAVPGGMEAYLS
jgi:RNA polymerase sigma-70 factor (ECF subfamily)